MEIQIYILMDISIEPTDINTIRKEGLECEDATNEVKQTIQILHIPKNTGLFLFVLNIR